MLNHRRNNVAAGLIVVSGALLLILGAFLPLLTLKSPDVGLNIGIAEVSLQYQQELVPVELQMLLIPLGLLLALLGLFLIATRIRGLGILWRVGSLTCFALAGGLALYCWNIIGGDPIGILNASGRPNEEANDELGDFLEAALQNTGLLTVNPGIGLYVVSLGSALTFIGCCIPATRRTEVVQAPLPPSHMVVAPHGSTRALQATPSGWYHVEGGYRYWDGQRWTDEFSPDVVT